MMYELIKFIPFVPLAGFLVIGLLGKYLRKEAIIGAVASGTVGISFILSLLVFIAMAGEMPQNPHVEKVFTWIAAGRFHVDVAYQADRLSILFSLIVTGVGCLIHVYSIGYMRGDRSFARYFAYMNLFIFMMLNLVLSSSFLLTFLGWEGVGLCSYLLIGFWYDKKFDGTRITWTGDAANKAFIVNRVGDFGFLVAMFLIYLTFGSLEYSDVQAAAVSNAPVLMNSGLMTFITLMLFLGCTGKSAQIPLSVWLPDAMAGPTPVSALIHAATMVTAGVFLIARNAAMFALSPTTMHIVAIVGVATAFFAGTIGLVQNDIKKVLAYSTVSQLGFMFAALGVGAFTAGIFHVMTHAFFKGLLFLGAGSVIHGMHEEQNIKKMGGLSDKMPITYKTFLVATLAISGIPLFSGFFSKDEILWSVWDKGGFVMWLVLAVSAFFTAFYMFRLLNLTFRGAERFDRRHVHPHESPAVMTIPLVILAVLSALGGFAGIPRALGSWLGSSSNLIDAWLEPTFNDAHAVMGNFGIHPVHSAEYVLMALSVCIALLAAWTANKWYSDASWSVPRRLVKNFGFAYRTLLNKYKLDELYFAVIVDPIVTGSRKILWKAVDAGTIDGFVNGAAKLTGRIGDSARRIQSGIAQNYAVLMLAGIIAILSILLLAM